MAWTWNRSDWGDGWQGWNEWEWSDDRAATSGGRGGGRGKGGRTGAAATGKGGRTGAAASGKGGRTGAGASGKGGRTGAGAAASGKGGRPRKEDNKRKRQQGGSVVRNAVTAKFIRKLEAKDTLIGQLQAG